MSDEKPKSPKTSIKASPAKKASSPTHRSKAASASKPPKTVIERPEPKEAAGKADGDKDETSQNPSGTGGKKRRASRSKRRPAPEEPKRPEPKGNATSRDGESKERDRKDRKDSAADAERPRAGESRKEERSERVEGLQETTRGFIEGLGKRAWSYADSHPHTVLYAVIAFIVAVLLITVGFWDTLVISIFVLIGVAIGQVRDGDGQLYKAFIRLFGGR